VQLHPEASAVTDSWLRDQEVEQLKNGYKARFRTESTERKSFQPREETLNDLEGFQ